MNGHSGAMTRARDLFDKLCLTLNELGQRMGAATKTARMSAWQFLNKTGDPRLSMLLKFCNALGISIEDLFGDGKKRSKSRSG